MDFTDENSQNRTCKECEKKTFLILQMKTHIRDNHAEYRKIETSGLNPNHFEPKNVNNLQMKTYIRDNHAEY